MPDLDQIKQGEQGCGTGAGGSPGAGRAIPPAGRSDRVRAAPARAGGGRCRVARHCNLLPRRLRGGRHSRTIGQFRTIMIPMQFAGAMLALAIFAVFAPAGRSDAANQVIEMPDGLKYTDTKTGDGAAAKAGSKVSVHYTGWLSDNGAKGKKFDSSVDRGQPFR